MSDLIIGERISERICEQIADVHVPQVAEQVLGETKTPSRDQTLQGTVEHILDVLVSDMVEQLVRLPKTVSDEQNPGADCGAYRRRHSSSCKVCRGNLVAVSKVFSHGQDPTAFCGADQ